MMYKCIINRIQIYNIYNRECVMHVTDKGIDDFMKQWVAHQQQRTNDIIRQAPNRFKKIISLKNKADGKFEKVDYNTHSMTYNGHLQFNRNCPQLIGNYIASYWFEASINHDNNDEVEWLQKEAVDKRYVNKYDHDKINWRKNDNVESITINCAKMPFPLAIALDQSIAGITPPSPPSQCHDKITTQHHQSKIIIGITQDKRLKIYPQDATPADFILCVDVTSLVYLSNIHNNNIYCI